MRQLESFFWGIIAALGALFVELLVFIGYSIYRPHAIELTFTQFFTLPAAIIVAAAIEEALKYLMVSKRVDLVSFEKSYIINACFVGLGFFTTEFVLIQLSSTILPTLRILGEIALIHVGTAGILGYLVALKNPGKISTFVWAVFLTTFLHSAYNLLILKRSVIENYAIFLLLGLLVLFNVINFFRISYKLAQD